MKKISFLSLLLFFVTTVNAQNFKEFAATISEQFELPYILNIANDPISARNIFINDNQVTEDYLNYVTQQNPNWYLRYFSLNGLRKKGWNNHWELYNNRFLTWMNWRQDLFLSVADFDWYTPRNRTPLFNALNGYVFSPVDLYRIAYFQEQWLINTTIKSLNESLVENLHDGNGMISNQSGNRYAKSNTNLKLASTNSKQTKQVKSLKTVINSLRSNGIAYESVKKRANSVYGSDADTGNPRFTAGQRNSNAGGYRMYDNNVPMQSRGNYNTPAPAVRVQTVVSQSTGYAPPSGGSTSVSAGRKQ